MMQGIPLRVKAARKLLPTNDLKVTPSPMIEYLPLPNIIAPLRWGKYSNFPKRLWGVGVGPGFAEWLTPE